VPPVAHVTTPPRLAVSGHGKKIMLFERGAQAAELIYGQRGIYYCPICGNAHGQAALQTGELTLEHVPPASVGGKAIALTCRRCNNPAGGTVDAAMSQRAEQMRFAELIIGHSSDYAGPAIVEIGGDKLNVWASRTEDGRVSFSIVEQANNPQIVRRVYERGLVDESIRVSSRVRYHGRLAQVGALRSAYLVAFAALGYSYAFAPQLKSVREQISHPRESLISGWTLAFANSEDAPPFQLLLSTSPPALVVKLRDVGVMLPTPTGPLDFYEQLRVRHRDDRQVRISGRPVEWPTTLAMACDFRQRPDG